jgi:hypothetical protein
MLYWGAVLVEVGVGWLLMHGHPSLTVAVAAAVGVILLLLLDWLLERRTAARSL